jgi:GT2 family glycosyltransferase
MGDSQGTVRASVIMVSYNSREDLLKGFPSILASLGARDEIILVDNASQDGCIEAVRESFPTIRVIQSATNLGFGGANNLGAESATGEFLAFLNPDTCVEPGWLDALVEPLMSDPLVGMTTSKIVLMGDHETINTCGNDVHMTGLTLCRGMGHQRNEYEDYEDVAAVSGAAFAIRRHHFLELGGFDADFFLYMEDTDLSLRIRLAGLKIIFVPDSVVYHAYRLRFGPLKVFYQERNRYLMLVKNLTWRSLFIMVPILIFGEIVTWGFVILRDRARVTNKIKAYGWVLSHWQVALKLRNTVQSNRKIKDSILLSNVTPVIDFNQIHSHAVLRVIFSLVNNVSFWLTRLLLKLI